MRLAPHIKWALPVLAVLALSIIAYRVTTGPTVKYVHTGTDIFFYTLFGGEDKTHFANAYSEEGFSKIKRGMSKADVMALVGEPLKKQMVTGGYYSEVWRYTDAPHKSNYWFRVVRFDQSEKVVETEAKYLVG